MASKKKKDDTQFDKLTFEEAIESLTDIVNQIETGQVPLAESLQKYEKGMAIIRHCRQILLEAEKRIEEIAEDQPEHPAPKSSSRTDEDDDIEDVEEDEEEEDQENETEQLF
jgi:exodeoxyribonuclease VII small subunit